jgi:hypothetical protein
VEIGEEERVSGGERVRRDQAKILKFELVPQKSFKMSI